MRARIRWWWVAAAMAAALAGAVPVTMLTRAQPRTLTAAAASGPVVERATVSLHSKSVTLHVGGRTRHYHLFVPSHLPAGPHRMLVVLHALHWTATAMESVSRLDAGAEAANAVVVYPDGVQRSWDAGDCCGDAAARGVDDVAFLSAVITDAEARADVDPDRVALTGFSNGALMSYRMLCERSDLVHVAVTVAGDMLDATCRPAVPVSVLHVHGGRDLTIPLGGENASPLDSHGFPAAAASVERLAAADECTGAVTAGSAGGADWTATGCAGGAHVELLTRDALPHRYPAGAAAASAYGIDMTSLTWTFVTAEWRR